MNLSSGQAWPEDIQFLVSEESALCRIKVAGDLPESDHKMLREHVLAVSHREYVPEFEQEADPNYKELLVKFKTKEDYDKFQKLIEQKLTVKTKSIFSIC